MCNHRAVTRWHKFWARLSTAYLVGFLAPEIYGLVTVGPEATFSAWSWHSLGTREPCRHSRAGRTAIVAVGLWLIAHLGWGRLGFALPAGACAGISPQSSCANYAQLENLA